MNVNHLFLCFVMFFSAACFNTLDAISEHAKDSLTLDTNSQNCNCENGRCATDKQRHSKCVCKPGFSLQDEFTCKPCDCGSLGKCIFILKLTDDDKYEYQKKCVCDVGKAEKDGVCVDCFCGENSACDFDYGERKCYCIEGYSEKDGVCTKCDCGFNGECEYENGIKKCKCDEGYLELNGVCEGSCDEDTDCHNGGKCRYRGAHKFCRCLSGTQGPRCQIVDDCYSGRVICRGLSASCVFDVDRLKGFCKCKDENDVYDVRNGRCRRIRIPDYHIEMEFDV